MFPAHTTTTTTTTHHSAWNPIGHTRNITTTTHQEPPQVHTSEFHTAFGSSFVRSISPGRTYTTTQVDDFVDYAPGVATTVETTEVNYGAPAYGAYGAGPAPAPAYPIRAAPDYVAPVTTIVGGSPARAPGYGSGFSYSPGRIVSEYHGPYGSSVTESLF